MFNAAEGKCVIINNESFRLSNIFGCMVSSFFFFINNLKFGLIFPLFNLTINQSGTQLTNVVLKLSNKKFKLNKIIFLCSLPTDFNKFKADLVVVQLTRRSSWRPDPWYSPTPGSCWLPVASCSSTEPSDPCKHIKYFSKKLKLYSLLPPTYIETKYWNLKWICIYIIPSLINS